VDNRGPLTKISLLQNETVTQAISNANPMSFLNIFLGIA
jgi:hypothetical protein